MPETAAHGAEARPRIAGAEADVWTERMLSALVNGVKGGKWFSLMDKVFAPRTLALAWTKVRANKGAAGVDGQSIERFAAKADLYLPELSAALRDGTYQPQPVKRVDIPKGDGRTRPLGIPTVKDRVVAKRASARRPAGSPARHRADLRARLRGGQLRLPPGAWVP